MVATDEQYVTYEYVDERLERMGQTMTSLFLEHKQDTAEAIRESETRILKAMDERFAAQDARFDAKFDALRAEIRGDVAEMLTEVIAAVREQNGRES